MNARRVLLGALRRSTGRARDHGRVLVPIRFVALLLAATIAAFGGCARGGDTEAVARGGNLTFEASLDPPRPRLEDNRLELRVFDAERRPVTGAEIAAEATMPAMGGMPAMRSRAEVEELGDGRYRAVFDVGMSGTWQLTIDTRSASGAGVATYSFTTGQPGLVARDPGPALVPPSEVATAGGDGDPSGIAHYTCSMHTSVQSDRPGTCPICSMDLVPVTREELRTGVIRIDPRRWQTIGVRTAAVERRPLRLEVRAVGKVTFDETRISEVSVKYAGWIGELQAASTGQQVRKGESLFTLYSPELWAAQQELLTAVESQRAARATSAPDRADYLVEASRQRLRLWDLDDAQIDRIAESGEPVRYLPFVSPVSGHVIEKNVVAGASVQPGMALFRIAGLDRVWVEVEIYESELPLVSVGQRAEVTLPYLPGRRFEGRVAFVFPYLEGDSRTGRARIELANQDAELKPDMYAEAVIALDRGMRLMVPDSAVLFAGTRRLVFRDLGEGRLEPRDVVLGPGSGGPDGFVEVLEGLEEGDVVVTSGTFLVAAESRLKAAEELWR